MDIVIGREIKNIENKIIIIKIDRYPQKKLHTSNPVVALSKINTGVLNGVRLVLIITELYD